MPKKILTILILLSLSLFSVGSVQADWLDKLKDTAKELTDKAGQAIKEAAPEAPSTSDGEGQVNKPATTAAPSKPVAPETKTVATPTAPSGSAVTGNNDKTLVMATQKELKRLGYDIGVDGAYGPNTKKQIIAFQKTQNITASGDASPELLATLKATPTPQAEPATATAAAPKVEEKTAEEPKVAQVEAKTEPVKAAEAAPQKSLDPNDYDRVVYYEGSTPEQEGIWEFSKSKGPETIYGKIKGDGLIVQRDLRSMKVPPGVQIHMLSLVREDFRKSDNYDPPSVILIRFDGTVITAKNISPGNSATLTFHAKGSDVAALRTHIQNGGNFEFRVDKFEPFEYSKDWTTFSSPPPDIAAAKLAKKEAAAKAAAEQQAAQKAKQENSAAIAATLSPEGKVVFEQCDSDQYTQKFYSCSCLGTEIDHHVDAQVAESAKYQEQLITGYENSIQKNNASPTLSADRKAQLEKGMRKKIEQAKLELATLQNKAGWNEQKSKQMVQTTMVYLGKEPVCKIPDGVRADEYGKCMKSSSSHNVKGKTAEEYCSCSADKVAELWTTSERGFDSNLSVSMAVQARTQCRK